MNSQDELFYDGPYDALEKAIAASGKNKKTIATMLYPGCQPETAKSRFSRALSPEYTDVNITLENLIAILRESRPDDFLYWICDAFGFERPQKKTKANLRREVQGKIDSIQKQLAALLKQFPTIEEEDLP
jgi:hypothetical protein